MASPATVTLYLDVLFFIYGLSFMLLGIVVAVSPKEDSQFDLARIIWLLAAFAFIHGIMEFMDLWRVVRSDRPWLTVARPVFLFASFLCLFEFGRRLLRISLAPETPHKLLVAALSPACLLVALLLTLTGVATDDAPLTGLTIWSRYLLGFFGSLLTGLGFLCYCEKRIRPALVAEDFPPIRNACLAAAFTFFAYGILGGLVVPREDWFPANWLNQEVFIETLGLPVQMFRASCAIVVALAITQLLWLFHIETHQRLLKGLTEASQFRHRDEMILRSVAEGICGVDIFGKIVFINQSALSMLGYAEEEMLGQAFAPPYRQSSEESIGVDIVHHVLQDGQIRSGEFSTLKRKDGSCFPVEYRAAPMMDGETLSGAVLTFLDISERRQAQEELDAHHKTINAITSSTQDAIIMMDDNGKISFWNQGAESMFGYAAAEALGENLHGLLASERFLPAYQTGFARWRDTGQGNAVGKTLELVGVKKGGQELPIELSLSSVLLRRRWHAVAIVRDITLRKQQEDVLNQAKKAAESANRAKSEFLANMSHEIRTPMNAVMGLIRLVLDTPLNPQQQDFLHKAYASSRALLNILNDILDYSKIEAGRLEVDRVPFDVEETLKEVADLYAARMAEKGLELFLEIAPELPGMVAGDPMRLGQILHNLVGNAVKFTDRGEIHIKAELAYVDGDKLRLRFAVRDTGIGLTKEQKDRLFQAFTQGDGSITRKYGGTGLGLTICQRLVRLMGGEISAQSEPGQGSTFTFTIMADAVAARSAPQDLRKLANFKVLAVDDQETSRMILKQLLDTWGLEGHTAASGEDALAQIEEAELHRYPFNAVVLDWRMPGMSGLDVARKLQEGVEQGCLTHPLLVVMITAYDKQDLLAQTGSIRLDGVLTKPVTPSSLFNALANIRPPLAEPAREASLESLPDFQGASVLLVEDNAINQQVAAEFLKRLNLQVTLANHGGEAVEWVRQKKFDAVLMDLHMPTVDGLEATQRIRLLPGGEGVPIIAMTAAVMPEDRQRCAQSGMVDFVCKPIEPEELTQVLMRWLKHQSPAQALPPAADAQTEATPQPCLSADKPPGFDFASALRRLGGDRSLLLRLLRNFAVEQASLQARLDALLDGGESQQATLLLHTLKGVAANLGISDVSLQAQRLEQAVKTGQGLDSRPQFAAALASALESIASMQRTEPTAPPRTDEEDEELAKLLYDLIPFLRESEVIPEAAYQQLLRLSANATADSALVRLTRQIDQFDFAAALDNASRLAETLHAK